LEIPGENGTSINPNSSVVHRVTAALVSAVLDGRYPPGTRLPPERDLAEELDTSRVSVRSAIGRLVEWGVVSSRQGSGITVRPRRRWTAGVLASVVERALARGDFDELVPLFADARSLRRWVVLDMLERAADHFAASPPALGEHPLVPVRAIVDEAWEHVTTPRSVALDRDTPPGSRRVDACRRCCS
jgi:DNA-binding transcriptional MocR family regulator